VTSQREKRTGKGTTDSVPCSTRRGKDVKYSTECRTKRNAREKGLKIRGIRHKKERGKNSSNRADQETDKGTGRHSTNRWNGSTAFKITLERENVCQKSQRTNSKETKQAALKKPCRSDDGSGNTAAERASHRNGRTLHKMGRGGDKP